MKPYIQFYPTPKRVRPFRHAAVIIGIYLGSALLSAGFVWAIWKLFEP